MTWESLATHKDKELLRERFKIVKSIVDGVFGKGENIKIALKNHSENKSALEVVKEFKFPPLKPKPTTETTAETKENDTKKVQETQPKEAPTALQEFMANHSDLIEEIKSEFEIKSVELL